MPDRITITEADLRKAISDPLYRSDWDPDHRAYVGWVRNGFRALNNAGVPKGGSVEVSAYERRRGGKIQQVGAHTRGAPERGGLETPAMGPALREGAKIVLPRIIGSLPGWAARLPPLRRPSLLDPPESGKRRRGTLGGAVQSVAPEEGDDVDGGGKTAEPSTPETPDGERPRYWINGHQPKHTWPPDREFVPGRDVMPDGRSAIRPEEDAQAMVDEAAGTGERRGQREHVDFDRVIGTWRDRETGEVAATTRATIHYGKDGGTHIVPSPPRHVRDRNAR